MQGCSGGWVVLGLARLWPPCPPPSLQLCAGCTDPPAGKPTMVANLKGGLKLNAICTKLSHQVVLEKRAQAGSHAGGSPPSNLPILYLTMWSLKFNLWDLNFQLFYIVFHFLDFYLFLFHIRLTLFTFVFFYDIFYFLLWYLFFLNIWDWG